MSVGSDVYCDSLLILEHLEKIYPAKDGTYKNIGATNGTEYALEKLFEKWTDIGVFGAAAAVIPSDMEMMKDPKFQEDREELWGRPWTKVEQDKLRPAGLANIRANFDFLETVLSDGRDWVLGGRDGPKLADVHACWIFDWLLSIPGALDEEYFNAKRYPRTSGWRDRYRDGVAKAKDSAPTPTVLDDQEAVKRVLSSGAVPGGLKFEKDPLGLAQGQEVQMYPIDTGSSCKDAGKLVGLNSSEAVVSTTSNAHGKELRIHYPRWNFVVESVSGSNGTSNGH